MLAATLKGTMLMGLTALAIGQAMPAVDETARVEEAAQEPVFQLLIETEVSQPDEIILIWS